MSDNEGFRPTYDTCDEVSDRCPVEATFYGADLSQGAAVFFGIAFLICLLAQLYFGFRARTWGFSIWLGFATLIEGIGYLARFNLARNPWSLNTFIVQYLCLLLAPTLVAAAISVTFKSLVLWYGKQWSVLRPRLYPWIFVGTDFLSIFIQIMGGGATAAATTGGAGEGVRKLGEALVIGGVSFQVANMLGCGSLMLIYIKRRKAAMTGGFQELQGGGQQSARPQEKGHTALSRATATAKEAKRTRLFIYSLAVAYVAIIIRCTYRIAETVPDISRDVQQIEGLFLVLDGGMILIAIGLVSFIHPYIFFPYLGVRTKDRQQFEMAQDVPMNDSPFVSSPPQGGPPADAHYGPPPPAQPQGQNHGYTV